MTTPAENLIERLDGVSYEAFRSDFLFKRRPVILTDTITRWKAVERWTPEFFESEFGDRSLEVDGDPSTVAEFVHRVLQSSEDVPGPYLKGTGPGHYLADLFPELVDDIEPRPVYLQPNWLEDRFFPAALSRVLNRGPMAEIFFGGCGTGFPVLHWDYLGYHAFAFQIYGTKEWTLFSPSDSENLYPKPDWPNQSQVTDLEHPDQAGFPRFANATRHRFVLQPGEMLFLPCGWWHTTRLPGPSISVSINSANASNWWSVVYWMSHTRRFPKNLVIGGLLAGHRAVRALHHAGRARESYS